MARTRIGLISDTHGLLRPQAVTFLTGSDRIVHAGDVGNPAILDELGALAPVTAVRGNNDDRRGWAAGLRDVEWLEIGGIDLYVVHDLAELDIDPVAAGVRVVVHGHSHRPAVRDGDGVLFVNPGSAGPRRFSLPVAVAELVLEAGTVSAHVVELDVRAT